MKDMVAEETALDRLERIICELRRFQSVIEKALSYSDNSHTFDNVCGRVIDGSLDLYVLPNSVMLCETFRQPNFSQYHVYLGGGDLQEIIDYHPQMEREARLRGCKYLSMTGRLGWKKPLEQNGWTHKLSIYKKEVPDV